MAVTLGFPSQLQSYSAEAAELADIEHYIADGQQFELRRISVEFSVKLKGYKNTPRLLATGRWNPGDQYE